MLGERQIIDMIAMQIEDKSIFELAEAFNLSKGRVSQILRKEESQRLKQLMVDQIALRKANEIADK